ncbi:hypothetical protein L3Q82_026157 [Scortum barcoo]|uniref:Uncharacterized protein n=1 Tax=Scortum barcoo TaxID=214431 RepID=A0ACB8WI24_9TELE|nr:hypothetical protein L3Q82_026157 [Scortum barcoo]
MERKYECDVSAVSAQNSQQELTGAVDEWVELRPFINTAQFSGDQSGSTNHLSRSMSDCVIQLEESSSLTCSSPSFICRFFYTQVGFVYSLMMDAASERLSGKVPTKCAFQSEFTDLCIEESQRRLSAAWVKGLACRAITCTGIDKTTSELRWSSSDQSNEKTVGRFQSSVDGPKNNFTLQIRELLLNDSSTYYCAASHSDAHRADTHTNNRWQEGAVACLV